MLCHRDGMSVSEKATLAASTLSGRDETWFLRANGARAADEGRILQLQALQTRRSRTCGSGVPIQYKSPRICGSKLTCARQGYDEPSCLSCSPESTLAHTLQGFLRWLSIASFLIRCGTVRWMLCLFSLPALFRSLCTRLLCGFFRYPKVIQCVAVLTITIHSLPYQPPTIHNQ